MENTTYENYSINNRNFYNANRTTAYANSKVDSYNHQPQKVCFDIYDPENYYNNDKNSDPQKSQFISEAEFSNQWKPKDELEKFMKTQSYYDTEDFLEDEND